MYKLHVNLKVKIYIKSSLLLLLFTIIITTNYKNIFYNKNLFQGKLLAKV